MHSFCLFVCCWWAAGGGGEGSGKDEVVGGQVNNTFVSSKMLICSLIFMHTATFSIVRSSVDWDSYNYCNRNAESRHG